MTNSPTRTFYTFLVVVALVAAAFGFAPQTSTVQADDPGNPAPPTMTATPTASPTPCPTATPDNRGEGNPDHGLC